MCRVHFAFPVFFLTAMVLSAQDKLRRSQLWEHTLSSDFDHFEVTALGTLLVSTDDETAVLDPDTGKVIWSSSVLRDCDDVRNPSPWGGHYKLKGLDGKRVPYVWCRWKDERYMRLSTYPLLPIILAASGKDLVVLDIGNGDVIWDASKLDVSLENVGWSVRTAEARVIVWGQEKNKNRSLILDVDIQSGEVLWRTELPMKENLALLSEDDRFIENLALVSGGDFLVMTGENSAGRVIVATVDPNTGVLLYANELPFKADDWDFLRRENPIMLMGEPRNGEDIVIGIDIPTGEVLYSSTLLAKELEDTSRLFLQASSVTFEEFGDTLEVFADRDRGIIGVDPWTGAVLWNPEQSRRYDSLIYGAGTLFLWEDEHLTAYRPSDGAQLWQWESDDRYPLRVTGRGVLVGCGWTKCEKELNFLDLDNGESMWEGTVELDEKAVQSIIIGDALFAVSEEHVYRVDLATGSYREFLEFDFHGGEVPTALSEQDGGLLLRSDQNILFVDAQGEFQYHKYYKSPGMSFWKKVAITAGAAAFNAVSAAGARSQAQYRANLSSAAGGPGVGYASYSAFYPDLSRRYGASSRSGNDLYMYTEDPDASGREGFSLVRVNLDNGEELGRAWVDQRKPEFVFDPIGQIVYVRRDDTIEALTFEPAN